MAKVTVEIKDEEVLAAFQALDPVRQTSVYRHACNTGAQLISTEASRLFAIELAKNGRSGIKARDMVTSIGYRFDKNQNKSIIHPMTGIGTGHYAYMAKWLIAGTEERSGYNLVKRTRSSGKLTKRRYRERNNLNRGKIDGNDCIVRAYNNTYHRANELIIQDLSRSLERVWNKAATHIKLEE